MKIQVYIFSSFDPVITFAYIVVAIAFEGKSSPRIWR